VSLLLLRVFFVIVIVIVIVIVVVIVVVIVIVVVVIFRHNFWSREFDSSQRCRAIDSNDWCSAEPRN
jgi:hypothetical protein